MMHILAIEADALDGVNRAAEAGDSVRWIVPKSATSGDIAVLFFRPHGFLGSAKVMSKPIPATFGRKSAFCSVVGKIVLFSAPIPLMAVADMFPEWGWPKYPRSYTSVTPPFSDDLLRFLTSARGGPIPDGAVMEGIAHEGRVLRRSRNRALRQEALRRATGICAACGVKYSEVLGGLGECVLQVHHRKQLALARTPRKTAIEDLAVLCANCHSIIHADPEIAITVEELQARWRR